MATISKQIKHTKQNEPFSCYRHRMVQSNAHTRSDPATAFMYASALPSTQLSSTAKDIARYR